MTTRVRIAKGKSTVAGHVSIHRLAKAFQDKAFVLRVYQSKNGSIGGRSMGLFLTRKELLRVIDRLQKELP